MKTELTRMVVKEYWNNYEGIISTFFNATTKEEAIVAIL